MENKDLNLKIKEVLDQLRVFVNQDGGDMEFVAIKDRIVYIRLKGNCVGCDLTDLTFKEGVQQVLFEEFPDDIDGVELVL